MQIFDLLFSGGELHMRRLSTRLGSSSGSLGWLAVI
jgi:hypothetical protein